MSIVVAINKARLHDGWREVFTFIGITFVLSALVWLLLAHHALSTVVLTGMAMWCPGIAALLTRAIYRRNVLSLPWQSGKIRYLLLGTAFPLTYCLLTYVSTWLVEPTSFNARALRRFLSRFNLQGQRASVIVIFLVVYVVFLAAISIFSAAGEEIGWRGLLVPGLRKMTSFRSTALLSGLIWALWHYPLILLSSTSNVFHLWYPLLCFTIMITAMGVLQAWLRLQSHSLWPVILLHAVHNFILQQLFSPLTSATAWTGYVLDETGAGLALVTTIFAVALLLMMTRRRISSPVAET